MFEWERNLHILYEKYKKQRLFTSKKEGKEFKIKTFFFFKYCFTKKRQLFYKHLFLRGFFLIELFIKKHYPLLQKKLRYNSKKS